MGCKVVETICNINSAFDPGTANKCLYWKVVVQEVWQRRWELLRWECYGQPSEVDSDQLKAIIKADPLTTTWEVAKELSVDHALVVWHLKQIVIVIKLSNQMPHELTTNEKNGRFEVSSSLILCSSNNPFLNWIVMCNKVDFLWQLAMTNLRLEREEAPKHLPKPDLLKKRSWSLVVYCQSDQLQLSESWWNHYIWEECSANWWDALKTATPAASIGQ